MIRRKTVFIISMSLMLSSCSKGEEIPEENTDNISTDINPGDVIPSSINAEAIEKNAQSIREAAAEAVRIVEQDAQQEIDGIAPITDLPVNDAIPSDDNQKD